MEECTPPAGCCSGRPALASSNRFSTWVGARGAGDSVDILRMPAPASSSEESALFFSTCHPTVPPYPFARRM